MLVSDLNYGSVTTFKCDTGFEQNGSKTRHCQANGEWNGTRTVCSSKTSYDCVPYSCIHCVRWPAPDLTCHSLWYFGKNWSFGVELSFKRLSRAWYIRNISCKITFMWQKLAHLQPLRGRRQLQAFFQTNYVHLNWTPSPPNEHIHYMHNSHPWKNADQEIQVLSTWCGTYGSVWILEVIQVRPVMSLALQKGFSCASSTISACKRGTNECHFAWTKGAVVVHVPADGWGLAETVIFHPDAHFAFFAIASSSSIRLLTSAGLERTFRHSFCASLTATARDGELTLQNASTNSQ